MLFLSKNFCVLLENQHPVCFGNGIGNTCIQVQNLENKIWKSLPVQIADSPSSELLHCDITLPYDTDLTSENVEGHLSDILGKNREQYHDVHYHVYYQEDTQQGTLHRVLITLAKKNGALTETPVEGLYHAGIGVLAFAEKLQQHTREENFQLLIQNNQTIYSLIYRANLPYHLLVLPIHKSIDWERLGKQLLFSFEQASQIPLYSSHHIDSPIPLPNADQMWAPKTLPFKLLGIHPNTQLLAIGLIWAHHHPELSIHNLANSSSIHAAKALRHRRFFAQAVTISTCLIMLVVASMQLLIYWQSSRLKQIKLDLGPFAKVAESIHDEQMVLHTDNIQLDSLKPVWKGVQNWGAMLSQLENALPAESAIEGLMVRRTSLGNWEWQFRLLVSHWEDFGKAERNLLATQKFQQIHINQQVRDEYRNRFSALVTCKTTW